MTKKRRERKPKKQKPRGSALATRETPQGVFWTKDGPSVLDHVFQTGASERRTTAVTASLSQAAMLLAPHFGITNAFADQGGEAGVPDTKVLVEILCSAGAWLAFAKDMPKEELQEKFEEWMKDQGYL